MRLRPVDLIAVLALPAGAFFWFGSYFWHEMPPALSFGGVWASASVFCLVALWHILPDRVHRHVLANAPWFVILGAIMISAAGMGTYQLQAIMPPPATAAKPSVLLMADDKQLRLYNRGDKDIYLWGDKLDDLDRSVEQVPRTIPHTTGFYYFLLDRLNLWVLGNIGLEGSRLVPFAVYLTDQRQNKYTANFALLIVVTNGKITIHTQQLGITDDGW